MESDNALQRPYPTITEAKRGLRAAMDADGHTPQPQFNRHKAAGPDNGWHLTLTCDCGVTGHLWTRDRSVLYSGIAHND